EARAVTDPAISGGIHVRLQKPGTPGMIKGSQRHATPLQSEPELIVLGSASDTSPPLPAGSPPAPASTVAEAALALGGFHPAAPDASSPLSAVPLSLLDQFPGALLL